jgi:hypothetical protein
MVDAFYADMRTLAMESMADDMSDTDTGAREPDQSPDAAYADMAIQAIWADLDEFNSETAAMVLAMQQLPYRWQ